MDSNTQLLGVLANAHTQARTVVETSYQMFLEGRQQCPYITWTIGCAVCTHENHPDKEEHSDRGGCRIWLCPLGGIDG